MKEKPILFSAPMVRAILEGRKAVTRRIVKPQPPARNNIINAAYCGHPSVWLPNGNISSETPREWKCPYGQPGDRLWVRETWQPDPPSDNNAWDDHTDTYFSWAGCGSRIDGMPPALRAPEHCIYREGWEGSALKWRPAIHMPRWASRITLQVTVVRVERLQDITEQQALEEGIKQCDGGAWDYLANDWAQGYSPRGSFGSLWQSLNGAGSWYANPWVWVVEFKRVDAVELELLGMTG